MAALDGAEQDDIRGYECGALLAAPVEFRRLCGVTAGQWYLVAVGKCQKSVEEASKPTLALAGGVDFGRNGEGQKCRQGTRAHSCHVAQAASQATVANHLWNMPVAPEVNLLERKIGSDDQFVCGGDTQDSSVIADADAEIALWPERPVTDSGDQGALSGGHLPSWIRPSGPRLAGFHREA